MNEPEGPPQADARDRPSSQITTSENNNESQYQGVDFSSTPPIDSITFSSNMGTCLRHIKMGIDPNAIPDKVDSPKIGSSVTTPDNKKEKAPKTSFFILPVSMSGTEKQTDNEDSDIQDVRISETTSEDLTNFSSTTTTTTAASKDATTTAAPSNTNNHMSQYYSNAPPNPIHKADAYLPSSKRAAPRAAVSENLIRRYGRVKGSIESDTKKSTIIPLSYDLPNDDDYEDEESAKSRVDSDSESSSNETVSVIPTPPSNSDKEKEEKARLKKMKSRSNSQNFRQTNPAQCCRI